MSHFELPRISTSGGREILSYLPLLFEYFVYRIRTFESGTIPTEEWFRRRESGVSSEILKAGEVYENPVIGERAVIRIGTYITGGELLVVDTSIRPGGAVMGEHIHPEMEERFTILRGRVGFRLAGRVSIAEPGVELIALPGTSRDWWNAGPEEALVRFEMRPAVRFEAMICNAFGLAQDGKVNKRGIPNVLQLAVFAREFSDVIQFTHPPRIVHKILFGVLTPLARRLATRGWEGCV